MQGQIVRGRPIRINLKTERRQSERERMPVKTYDRGWKSKDVPVTDSNPETAYAFDRWNRKDAESHWTAPAEEQRRLYVGGLPRIPNQDTVNIEMRTLFEGFNVQAVSKIISPHASKWGESGSHYYCYVDVSTPEEAQRAAQDLDGKPTPYSGNYKVSMARSTRGSNIVNREQLGTTSRIYVGGLPLIESQEELETQLRAFFHEYPLQKVTNLRTPHPSKQTEEMQGEYHYCFVEVESPQIAQKAVENLDGKESPSGGTYKVRLARDPVTSTTRVQGMERGNRNNTPPPKIARDFSGSWRRPA